MLLVQGSFVQRVLFQFPGSSLFRRKNGSLSHKTMITHDAEVLRKGTDVASNSCVIPEE